MSSSKRFLSGSIQTAVELVHDDDIIWLSKCPNFKPFFDWARAQIWPLCYSPNLRANPAKKNRKGLSLGVRVREHDTGYNAQWPQRVDATAGFTMLNIVGEACKHSRFYPVLTAVCH